MDGRRFLEQPNERKSKEDLGLEYFDELLSRSFFQRQSGSDSNFVMHDLINDLAHLVAGGTCHHLDEKVDPNQEYRMPEKTRHCAFLRHEYEVYRKFKAFNQVQGLRTFLPMPIQKSNDWEKFYLSNRILVELVPILHRLRVLSLSGYSITQLPSSICNLIHLRYLNLSGTSIETLPESVSALFHLQTLSLQNCHHLSKLPPALGKLSNLRHLDNSDTDQLKDMPVEIGELTNLQTLPKIVLSKVGGFRLRQLMDMKLLRGTLSLLELQNVTDLVDAKEESLKHKEKLDKLQLAWGRVIDDSRDGSLEEEVIKLLQPHENLKTLKVEFYGGSSFPSWIGHPAFCKLSSISITSCSSCTILPPLGQLPELKDLQISGMLKVKTVGNEFYGIGDSVPFPKLETLRFDDMPNWEKWAAFGDGEDAQIGFPHLQQLAIFRCSELTNVSPLNFPVLHELDIEECSKVLLESFCNLDSLIYLKIKGITGLSHLPSQLTKSLSALEHLECNNCNELLSIWPDEIPLDQLTHLKHLVVEHCSQLVSLGQGGQQLPCNLEFLNLIGCGNLVSLPNDLSNLGKLRGLFIWECKKFINFPENGIPSTLKSLSIYTCTALKSLPTNMSNLEILNINDCSSLTTSATCDFPTSLEMLSITSCPQLEPFKDTMFPQDNSMLLKLLSLDCWLNSTNLVHRLHGFSHLVTLRLSHCRGLKSFPDQGLPPNLRKLHFHDCEDLESLPSKIRTMTPLVSLEIISCPRLDNFPKYDLPPKLSSLRIWNSKSFKPLKQWGLHRLTSLREFSIWGGFEELELLGDDESLFPPSLIKFSIHDFPNLTSLSNVLENLASLRHLSIDDCTKVSDLPSDGLLEKLWHLEMLDCLVLEQRCLKDKGDYWPKIAGIPCVVIAGTYVYEQSTV